MSQSTPSAPAAFVCRRADVLWRRAGGTVVLLAPGAEQPIVVAGSGAALWDSLAVRVSIDDLVGGLAASYDTDLDVLRLDIASVLSSLVELGLVESA